MKRVEAIIKPHKLDDVSLALHRVLDVGGGVTVTDVRGFGRGKLSDEKEHPAKQAFDFEPHVKLELFCSEESVDAIAAALREAAHTGLLGDGLIVISDIDEAIRIRTGARGDEAI
jgi:nitrogen regulatory protein P-II 1